MARWRRLTKVGGVAVGAAAAGAGVLLAAEKIAVGRLRLRPDPAAGERFGQLRGRPMAVLTDDGVPLHAEVSGPDDAPVTIIFSHGYTLSQDIWHYQRQALAGTARLVFWDLRGHGRSGRNSDHGLPDQVSIERLGADLGLVLAATAPGAGPVVLAGHSMGGMTIMALAAQQPELFGTKVIGTVLISTAASGIDPAIGLPGPLRPVVQHAASAVLRGASQRGPAALIERGRHAAGDIAFLSTRYLAFGDPDVSPAVVDYLERIIRATPVAVVTEFYRALIAHDQRVALEVLGRVPTVVLTGERDRMIPARLTGEVAAAIPGADMILVPGAGHLLILERPEVVNQAITALVNRALRRVGSKKRLA